MAQRICPACGGEMKSLGTKTFQLGAEKFFSFFDEHLIQGGIDFEICVCPGCGKVELYASLPPEEYIEQYREHTQEELYPKPEPVTCSKCGKELTNLTQFICPHCGHDYRSDLHGKKPKTEKDGEPREKSGFWNKFGKKDSHDPW
ncbi:MAG: hypothetical protein ACOX81_02760 [Candidatus Heteroscillospira sp.]